MGVYNFLVLLFVGYIFIFICRVHAFICRVIFSKPPVLTNIFVGTDMVTNKGLYTHTPTRNHDNQNTKSINRIMERGQSYPYVHGM